MAGCCSISVEAERQDKKSCPNCGKIGKPVQALTIKALTKKDWPGHQKITDGYYCTNPNDPTVYYFTDKNLTIDTQDVSVRVGIKEVEEPIYVCYCFKHTKAEISEDFRVNGYSTIEEDVRKKVKEKECFCEISNPSGKCCLGDIRRVFTQRKNTVEEVAF